MPATHTIRPAAVAGQIYPDNPRQLRRDVEHYLRRPTADGAPPKGLIVPHAGYLYSGPVAGSAYARLKPWAEQYRRVVLLGPSHHAAFTGLATTTATAFESPLGQVPVDRHTCDTLKRLRQVVALEVAHQQEHSLEVQLPFLQVLLPQFELVPLVVGQASADEVAAVLDMVWGGPETLVIVSSDLSHYHDSRTAQRMDAKTVQLIEDLQFDHLSGERACGFMAIRGLLLAAKEHGLHVTAVDVRNSGDTAGPSEQVVGYAACVVS